MDFDQSMMLSAKMDGWDEGACTLDVDVALRAARNALDAIPCHLRPRASIEIYIERKRQIAAMIDADFLLPSYSGAKKMHETFSLWLQLLEGIPLLNATLLKNEIGLCESLCRRSKASFMPNERLVHVAYMEFNSKMSYGSSFEDKLRPLIVEQEHYESKIRQQYRESIVQDRDKECDVVSEKTEMEELIIGLSSRPLYQGQIDELQRQLSQLRPYNIGQRRLIRRRMKKLEKTMASIDEELAAVFAPMEKQDA